MKKRFQYIVLLGLCIQISTIITAESKKKLDTTQKEMIQKFMLQKMESNGRIYDAAFSDDANVTLLKNPKEQAIVNFLKTFKSTKLRQMVFFFMCDAPDINKIFKGFDKIKGGFVTTGKDQGFDPNNPLDATFKRLLTAGGSILNIVNTLDDQTRSELKSTLESIQPMAQSIIQLQKDQFYQDFFSDKFNSPEMRAIFEEVMNGSTSSSEGKIKYLKTYLSPEQDAEQVLKVWNTFATAEKALPVMGLYLENKTIIDTIFPKAGLFLSKEGFLKEFTINKPTPKELEKALMVFRNNGINISKETLENNWEAFGRLRKSFGLIGKVNTALGVQHGLTNAARFFVPGAKQINFDKDVIEDSDEFKEIFNNEWISQVPELMQSATGKSLYAALTKGVKGVTEFITEARKGAIEKKGETLAQDLAVLLEKTSMSGEQPQLALVDIITRYASTHLQKVGQKLASARAGVSVSESELTGSGVKRKAKPFIKSLIQSFESLVKSVVVDGLQQDEVAYGNVVSQALLDANQKITDQKEALSVIADYIAGEPVDIKNLISALTKTSYAKIMKELPYAKNAATYKMFALFKMVQVSEDLVQQGKQSSLQDLSNDDLLKAVDDIVGKIVPKSAKGQEVESVTTQMLENFVEELDSSQIVTKVTSFLTKDPNISGNAPSLRGYKPAKTQPGIEPNKTSETDKQKFYKFELQQFNDLYTKHFSGNLTPPVKKDAQLTGNPLVDTLRTFPPKMSALAFSLLNAGSAKDMLIHAGLKEADTVDAAGNVVKGKKNTWGIVKKVLSAAFGATKPQDREPIVNYLKATLDSGISLLNIVETVKPEDVNYIVSMLETLKPAMELAVSAKLTNIYKALIQKGKTFSGSLEDFDKKSCVDKMQFLTAYFNKNSNAGLQDIFKSFNSIGKLTAKIDGAIFFIKNKDKFKMDLFETKEDLEGNLRADAGMTVENFDPIFDAAYEMYTSLNSARNKRSILRKIQSLCNFFRKTENKIDYEANHYQTAQELTEDIKASPIGTIMNFLKKTTTGKLITAETKSIGNKILWIMTSDGSGTIETRIAEVVKDIKKLDKAKVQPLLDFVKQFVDEAAMQKLFAKAELGLGKIVPLPAIGRAARAVIDALNDVKDLFETPQETAPESKPLVLSFNIEMSSIAAGMLNQQKNNTALEEIMIPNEVVEPIVPSDNPLIQTAQERGQKLGNLGNLISTLTSAAQEFAAQADGTSVTSSDTMTQSDYKQKVRELCALKIATFKPTTMTDEEYSKVIDKVINVLQETTVVGVDNNKIVKESFEVQFMAFGKKLDDASTQELIKNTVTNTIVKIIKKRSAAQQIPEKELPTGLDDETADKISMVKLELKLILGLKSTDAVSKLSTLVENIIQENVLTDPVLCVALLHTVFEAIIPSMTAETKMLHRSIFFNKAILKSLESVLQKMDKINPTLNQWIRNACESNVTYSDRLLENEKKSTPESRYRIILDIITQYTNDKMIFNDLAAGDSKGLLSSMFGSNYTQQLVQKIVPLIKGQKRMFWRTEPLSEAQLEGLGQRLSDAMQSESEEDQRNFIASLKAAISPEAFGTILTTFKQLNQDDEVPLTLSFDGTTKPGGVDVFTLESGTNQTDHSTNISQQTVTGRIGKSNNTKNGTGNNTRGIPVNDRTKNPRKRGGMRKTQEQLEQERLELLAEQLKDQHGNQQLSESPTEEPHG